MHRNSVEEESAMKKVWNRLFLMTMCVIAVMLTSCPGGGLTGEAELEIKTRLAPPEIGTSRSVPVETDVNLTPDEYKIAMTYFSLVKDDDTEIVILDRTDDDPLIVDFSGETPGTVLGLFGSRLVSRGPYVGYRMRLLYLEMSYDAVFHVPDFSTDYDDDFIEEPVPTAKTFRQYFSAGETFWKRDFVVQKPNSEDPPADSWFWMRRELDNDHKDFFIDSATTAHPAGGAGPDNTLDLFANEDFWGEDGDLDDPDVKITIESGDSTGGLSATMEEFTLSAGTTLLLEIDITETMNYKEDDLAPPAGVTFHEGVMDIGPIYDPVPIGDGTFDDYGDHGFHPFLPKFGVSVLEL